jgi:glycerol-3-phosphate dehydrogenase
VFPVVRRARIIGTYAGVRPTLYAYGPNEDKLSRDHRVVDHREHGAAGLYSMIGGKLASYRMFAETMTDILARELGAPDRGTSHLVALPGGDEPVDAEALAATMGIDGIASGRLAYRHGSRAYRIAERVAREPREARVVCQCEPVTEAEIRYVVRHEHAHTVGDVARRTRLGFGVCGGMRCVCRAAAIVAAERGRPAMAGMQDALRFLHRQARTRVVGLGPDQARQEALAIAHLRSELGLGSVRGQGAGLGREDESLSRGEERRAATEVTRG